MRFFGKDFGKKKAPPEGAVKSPAQPVTSPGPIVPAIPTPKDPSQDKDMIRVFDGYGREFFISRQQWREKVLPGTLQKAWDAPEQLYPIIVSALKDGFRPEVIAATQHLYEIDTDRTRAACVWGIVLKDEDRLDEAEEIFRDFIAQHGEDGSILANLAKVHAKRGNDQKAEEILWHALEIDPNQENGMGWYEVMHRERGGKEASLAALKRIAALPGSWRAQLWLARASLSSQQLETAIGYYHEALAKTGEPVPAGFLMQMSGDLGLSGHLLELLEMTEPFFRPDIHGLEVGNNLIKAHIDLGHPEAARDLIDQLYALKRPDWQKTLSFWDTELAKKRVEQTPPIAAGTLQVNMLTVTNPVWLPDSSRALELFAAKTPEKPVVCFLGSSAETTNPGKAIQQQMADTVGRLSRALPLFLAEQVYFGTIANVQTFIPMVMGIQRGFVISGGPWSDEQALFNAARATPPGEIVVVSHIFAKTDPWTIEIRVVRVADSARLSTFSGPCSPANPDELLGLASRLVDALAQHSSIARQQIPPLYDVPTTKVFGYYLLRLEQLLAVRSASTDGVKTGFLSGEREIIDGNIQLCVECPKNAITRLVLAQTLSSMKRARPDILPEFQSKLELLQKEKPLTRIIHGSPRFSNEASVCVSRRPKPAGAGAPPPYPRCAWPSCGGDQGPHEKFNARSPTAW